MLSFVLCLFGGSAAGILLTGDAGLGTFVGGGLAITLWCVAVIIIGTFTGPGACRSCRRDDAPASAEEARSDLVIDGRHLAAAGVALLSAAVGAAIGRGLARGRGSSSGRRLSL